MSVICNKRHSVGMATIYPSINNREKTLAWYLVQSLNIWKGHEPALCVGYFVYYNNMSGYFSRLALINLDTPLRLIISSKLLNYFSWSALQFLSQNSSTDFVVILIQQLLILYNLHYEKPSWLRFGGLWNKYNK